MSDALDNLLNSAEALSWTGITCTLIGKDDGWEIIVPCAYTEGTHLDIHVVSSTTCRVTNVATGQTFETTPADVLNAVEVAAQNLMIQASRGLAA